MSLVLNTTLEDQFSNSYADIAYADAYFTDHYNTTKSTLWLALTDPQKTTLLIKACRIIETVRFTEDSSRDSGYGLHYDKRSQRVFQLNVERIPLKYYFYQNLQFPRNLDVNLVDGSKFIPEPVLTAQCEQAVYSLSFDDSAIANRLTGVVKDQTAVGSIRLRQEYANSGTELCPTAVEMLRPFMLKLSGKTRRQ